ncbi:conserved hypothetical protein [Acidovorax delafieldii 2AN]|uniref:DUF4148 domain-containing protein n=1 Tax=Acidovorax delafieldii 2AN TaxID=573060 RepID=C5T125_ACIDE|nr:DUF4148 domain-containing protein [Acidovorax delafieldii]EER61769.1 conserved hypothetical protein [Acidovorax delafieldii 2AN]
MKNTRKLITLAAIATAAFAGTASAATQSPQSSAGPEPVVQGPGLSRAEVLADLNLWARAGLLAYPSDEIGYASYPVYEARLAEYRRLRSGPEYLAEVRRLGG